MMREIMKKTPQGIKYPCTKKKTPGKCGMEQKKITNIIQNLFQFHFHIIANKDFNFTPPTWSYLDAELIFF